MQSNKHFTYSDWQEIGQSFFDIFHISSTRFLSIPMMWIFERPAIDIFRFESWLYKKYPNEVDLSIHDIVLKHYGEKGVELIQKLI